VFHGVAEGIPPRVDLGLEIAHRCRDPCRQLRHDTPGEVLELTRSGIARGQDSWPEPLEMTLAIEGQRSDVMGGDDLPGHVEDDDDPEIRQLIVAGTGDDSQPIADLLERLCPDRRREAGPERGRSQEGQGPVTEGVEIDRNPSAVEGSEQLRGRGGAGRRDDQRQPVSCQDLDERRQLRVENAAANQPGDPGGIGDGQDVHRRLRARNDGSTRAYSLAAKSAVERVRSWSENPKHDGSSPAPCDHCPMTTSPPAATELTIVPLTPERLDDLARLFDQPGDPKWCWCASFHVRRRAKGVAPAANRAVLTERATRVPAPGLLAYRDDVVVGWVSLGPREDFEKLAHLKVLAPVDERPVWSIVCFVVGRRERGPGLAGVLLDAAIDHARASGATTLEAYPADTGGGRIPSPVAYKGTLSMFERAGFTEVARRQASANVAARPIVRLEL
jgi:GNAT superfamily N-acetyltransferase